MADELDKPIRKNAPAPELASAALSDYHAPIQLVRTGYGIMASAAKDGFLAELKARFGRHCCRKPLSREIRARGTSNTLNETMSAITDLYATLNSLKGQVRK